MAQWQCLQRGHRRALGAGPLGLPGNAANAASQDAAATARDRDAAALSLAAQAVSLA